MLLPKPQSLALMIGMSLFSYNSAGQSYFPDSSRIKASATSLQADYLEFSPIFYDNGLLFVTSQKRNKKNRRYFDIAYAPFLEEGQLGAPILYKKLNTKYHEGPLTIKKDHKSALITRSSLEKGKPIVDSLGFNRLGIYEVGLSAENPFERKLTINGHDFSCVHPTLSEDETRLYFSSDRPGGFGGFDIWYSDKNGEKWSNPINLGEKINTESNELFPVFFQDSLLFFASNRSFLGVMMGLDIYEYPLHSGEVRRLPSPINSTEDDFGLILSAAGRMGYFSSNRAGSDDIYKYEIATPLPPQKIHFSLTIAENNSIRSGCSQQIPVGNASVVLQSATEQLIGQSNTEGLVSFEMVPKMKYKVLFSKEEYVSDSIVVWDSIDFVKTIFVKTKEKPCQSYQGQVTSADGHSLKNVSVLIIDKAHNMEMTTISGEQGNFNFCLRAACKKYIIQATKQGFIPYQVQVNTNQSPSFSLIPIVSNVSNPSFVLENIYYDFNDSKIRENSTDELIRLAQILKEHPTIDVLLVAYTDSRGTKKYNARLARHRARAAKAFLVKQGVDASRIKPVGRGEVNIRNKCKNGIKCSEEEHRYNRRTEVVFRNQPDNLQVGRRNVTTN